MYLWLVAVVVRGGHVDLERVPVKNLPKKMIWYEG